VQIKFLFVSREVTLVYRVFSSSFSSNLEEDVVDLLLASDEIPGFQSYPTRGHGQVGAMTIAEQVEGRRNQLQDKKSRVT